MAPEGLRQSYGGAVVDSSTSRLAGGISGTWNLQDPDGINRSWTDLRLSLGYPLGDRFGVGGTARYIRLDQSATPSTGPLGASFASSGTSDGGAILNAITFDLGATLIPAEGFRIGAVGKNLTNPGTGLAPTTVQGGSATDRRSFLWKADALADFTTWEVDPQALHVRRRRCSSEGTCRCASAYRYDDGTKNHALWGLGYIDKSWSFEVGARHDIVGEHPDTMISLSIRFFYNPEGTSGSPIDTSNQAF